MSPFIYVYINFMYENNIFSTIRENISIVCNKMMFYVLNKHTVVVINIATIAIEYVEQEIFICLDKTYI